MFLESIEVIKNSFLQYKGDGMYMALYFLCVLYIILEEKNENIKTAFGYFSIIGLIVICNPIVCIVMNNIAENVYWRLFWILPVGISMSYVFVKMIQKNEKFIKKFGIIICIIFIIIISGKFMYTSDNFEKTNNWYKISDEAVEIAEKIGKDNSKYKKVMLPETLVAYLRQIDSNIELIYGRQPLGYEGYELLDALHNGDVNFVTYKCWYELQCNYIIFSRETVLSDKMENFDYALFYQTEHYDIYKYMWE